MRSMMCRLQPILVLFASLATIYCERLVCPVNNQKFISTNRTLLPIENIMSTSYFDFNPTENFVNVGDAAPWCTDPAISDVAGQYVEISFTEPVVVAMLMSGGFISSYTNNFSLHYSMSTEGEDFQPYGTLKATQEFIVRELLTSNAHFILETQVPARRLRFLISSGVSRSPGIVCWKMLLFGCTMEEAQQIPENIQSTNTNNNQVSSTELSDTSNPSTRHTTESAPTDSSTVFVICPEKNGLLQSSVLLIVIPVVAVVILLIIVIIAVLICICCVKATHTQRSNLKFRDSIKEKVNNERTREMVESGTAAPSSGNFHYDNPKFICYDVPRSSVRSRQNSTAESISTLGSHTEIKNPAYVTKRSLQDECPYHIPPEDGNDYEDIPAITELDKRTVSNTQSNSSPLQAGNTGPLVFTGPPVITAPPSEPPKMAGSVAISDDKKPNNVDLKYSQVNKLRKKEETGYEYASPDYSSPVINDHYITSRNSGVALAQEIDRLANDLENSRVIARQW